MDGRGDEEDKRREGRGRTEEKRGGVVEEEEWTWR